MTTELVSELERRAARFAAVATVQQAISAAISLDETYHEIYTAVASVVDAPCFTLITADPVTETFHPQYAVVDFQERKSDDTASFPIGTRSISQAFQTGVPSISADSKRSNALLRTLVNTSRIGSSRRWSV